MTWQQGRAVIDRLLQHGELEKVAPNPEFASASLDLCDKHIAAAQVVLTTDPVGAVSLAYDASRKALAAMLLAQGLRPTRRGGHIAVTDDAIAVAIDAVQAARLVLPHLSPF